MMVVPVQIGLRNENKGQHTQHNHIDIKQISFVVHEWKEIRVIGCPLLPPASSQGPAGVRDSHTQAPEPPEAHGVGSFMHLRA